MALTVAPTRKVATKNLGQSCYPVAYIRGGDADGSKVWLAPDAHSGTTRIDMPIDSHLTVEPTADPERRDVLWCFGMSGSGKSTTLKAYAERYRQLFPRRLIVLISQLAEDSTLDSIADKIGMRRMAIKSLVEKPLTIEELGDEGCLVLFDDIDALPTKAEQEAVHNAMSVIATMGRHARCSMLIASHAPTNGLKSRTLLNECTGFVVYPHGCSTMALTYLLEKYASMDRDQIKAARKLRSRFFYVGKTFPPLIIADGCCYLLNHDE